jgi:hypothetical protein
MVMPIFVAFIDKRKAELLGLKIEDINSPYDIWHNKGLGDVYKAATISNNAIEPEDCPEVRRLKQNKNYVQKVVSCGN